MWLTADIVDSCCILSKGCIHRKYRPDCCVRGSTIPSPPLVRSVSFEIPSKLQEPIDKTPTPNKRLEYFIEGIPLHHFFSATLQTF
jgi:hypothetical protein